MKKILLFYYSLFHFLILKGGIHLQKQNYNPVIKSIIDEATNNSH